MDYNFVRMHFFYSNFSFSFYLLNVTILTTSMCVMLIWDWSMENAFPNFAKILEILPVFPVDIFFAINRICWPSGTNISLKILRTFALCDSQRICCLNYHTFATNYVVPVENLDVYKTKINPHELSYNLHLHLKIQKIYNQCVTKDLRIAVRNKLI